MEKNEEKYSCIKKAGQAVAKILNELKTIAEPGVSGEDLEKLAQEIMKKEEVESSVLNYKVEKKIFPAFICVSVNEVLTHGIPNKKKFKKGDLVSIDVSCNYKGYHADAALTVIVGNDDDQVKKNLIKITENCLNYVIQQIKPNITTNRDIGEMIYKYIKSRGYFPIEKYGGHGIGESLHEHPFIPNGRIQADQVQKIKTGMFICIEPLVQIGNNEVKEDKDGWSVISKDNQLNCHFEHTIYIGEKEVEIITK